MAAQLSCPLCNSPVDPQSRSCKLCGVDLALATAFAEPVLSRQAAFTGARVAPEVLVPRLGDHLLEKGLVTVRSGTGVITSVKIDWRAHLDRAGVDRVGTDRPALPGYGDH
jgi:hypothetical protein